MASEFTIEGSGDPLTGVLTVTNLEGRTRFAGDPAVLAKLVFWVGDVVWPGWQLTERGRRVYLGFADVCKKGEISLTEDHFLAKAWPRVRRHLEVDGVSISVAGEF